MNHERMKQDCAHSRHECACAKLRKGVMPGRVAWGCTFHDVVARLRTAIEANHSMRAPAAGKGIYEAPFATIPKSKAKDRGVVGGTHERSSLGEHALPPSRVCIGRWTMESRSGEMQQRRVGFNGADC